MYKRQEKNLKDSIEKKVGASEIPDMFSAYNDIAYTIDQMHGIVDLNKYFSCLLYTSILFQMVLLLDLLHIPFL